MDIVYGIIIGCIYEGGQTQRNLYTDKGEAEKEAMKIALAYNEDGAEYIYDKEKGWNEGSGYIRIYAFTIKRL